MAWRLRAKRHTYKTDQGALGETMLYDFDEDSYIVEKSRA